MKTKSHHKTAITRQFKHAWIAFAAVLGLIWAGSAQAQPVTGTPFLSNMIPSTFNPTNLYAEWAITPPTEFTNTSSGLIVSSENYGSMFYPIPTDNLVTLNTNDAEAVLTLEINNVSNAQTNVWIGIPFIINDNLTNVTLGGYAGKFGYVDTQTGGGWGSWDATGDIVTETVLLNEPGASASLLADIQAGGDAITGFNLEFDPAVYPAPYTYDVTFISLVLQPVPPLAITSSQYDPATGQITLTWASQATATYTILYAATLNSGFTPLVTDIPAGGTTTTYSTTAPTGSTGFFQILQQ